MNDAFFGGRKLCDFTKEELLEVNKPGNVWFNTETGVSYKQTSEDAKEPKWTEFYEEETLSVLKEFLANMP